MLVHCTNPDHKAILREVKAEPGKRKKIAAAVYDSASFCFVNSNGAHVTPRKCTCSTYRPLPGDREVSRWQDHEKFPIAEKFLTRIHGGGGAFVEAILPTRAYRALMMAIHGKYDPACPIEDAHEPINNNTAH